MIGSSIRDGVERKIINSVKIGGNLQPDLMNNTFS